MASVQGLIQIALYVLVSASIVGTSSLQNHVGQLAPERSASHTPAMMRSEAVITSAAAVQADEKMGRSESSMKPFTVQILYGSLCKPCAHLFNAEQCNLYNRAEFKQNWRFDLYPYGLAEKDRFNQTQCTHGRAECIGNSMHQCALDVLEKEPAMILITCLMNQQYWNLDVDNGDDNDAPDDASYQYPTATKKVDSVVNYKTQVAEPCWQKIHRPDWKVLVEKCMEDPIQTGRLDEYYRNETNKILYKTDQQMPSVFINGTFRDEASHQGTLCTFLQ
mmetsp:Transcript_31350/g.50341  ORF Transcript_31350/g.50341 Transcript_31350/m.50341 type:complete len:277 (-) Transcript_31350:6-836(-)